MKQRNLTIDYLVYLGFRLFAMVVHMFTIERNLATARLLGKIWYNADSIPLLRRLLGRGRNRALEHLGHAYPEWSDQQRQRIAKRSMQQLGMVAMEVLFTPRLITERTWHRYVRLGDIREGLRVLLSGSGAIMLTGHFGSWELLGYTMATLGFEINALFRPLDNPYLNDYLVASREHRGLRLLTKKGAATVMDGVLGGGGVLGFIADQDAGRKGLFVEFFGRKASTYKSIALLARQYRVPVLVGYARRIDFKRFHYEVGLQEVIRPEQWEGADDEVAWITRRFTKALEDAIRQAPDQYLWVHRRWKHRPKGEGRARNPNVEIRNKSEARMS